MNASEESRRALSHPEDPAAAPDAAEGAAGTGPEPRSTDPSDAENAMKDPSADDRAHETQLADDRAEATPSADEAVPARAGHSTKGRRTSRRQRMPLWLDTLVTMVVALVIAVLVKTFLIQPFYIPSASMNPTLLEDDKILVSKLTPGVFDLERGDVIVFEDPDGWIPGDATENPTPRVRLMVVLSVVGLAPDPSQDHLVKRLIGLPGDHVVCEEEGGALQVNGTTLDEPYINPETPACQAAFDVTVPDGKIWVMGDNRYASADSVWHEVQGDGGFVDESDVTGRAAVVFWPASRWTGLGDGAEAFADVPDAP
ncbi:signal peptidase I [Brachybacterium aquaticum]|uniref:Signal peptidase I n=1 Tax=Brachybacterium aquaticum TaxID=1432564 RepID=A0A841AA54_9MICO|nr:signal peptidase I [Brachybacterium aquaticum]MBB5832079.1 signal peptidase I [Brachybacterium aquaticum]